MRTAIITISAGAGAVANTIRTELGATDIARDAVAESWTHFDAFVFVGALGICVRTIAPFITDKHTDPAVVCVDSRGHNVISVLSGHVGGANDLARHIASALGVTPTITTQSDVEHLWALDTLAPTYGWAVSPDADMQQAIFRFVSKQPTALFMPLHDAGTAYLQRTLPEHVTVISDLSSVDTSHFALLIIVSPFFYKPIPDIITLQYIPRIASLGIGLAHQLQDDELSQKIDEQLRGCGVHPLSVCQYCTIDVKADEPYVHALQRDGWHVRFFTAEELLAVDVPTPSEMVAKHVGTPSVCEAAAILGADGGQLVVPKQKGSAHTIAVAIPQHYLRGQGGAHIEIVGAGPGDPDLISVRGRRFLEEADLILYAGSLVPRELTLCAKPGAVVRSSATMTLEQQCELMKEFYDRGALIVRLHTGDPCIFGAIQEQMAFFDANGMSYHITPGISSFLAAASELRSQFTIPERCQTIILTRGEGRTPMPEREQLHLLARSRSTMCIFLSASIVDDVQRQLLMEYPPETPVAACYHLTWKDQRIYRGQLKDLARIVHDNHLTLTTMIVVGDAIDNRSGLSELYSGHFTHLFRKGDNR